MKVVIQGSLFEIRAQREAGEAGCMRQGERSMRPASASAKRFFQRCVGSWSGARQFGRFWFVQGAGHKSPVGYTFSDFAAGNLDGLVPLPCEGFHGWWG